MIGPGRPLHEGETCSLSALSLIDCPTPPRPSMIHPSFTPPWMTDWDGTWTLLLLRLLLKSMTWSGLCMHHVKHSHSDSLPSILAMLVFLFFFPLVY